MKNIMEEFKQFITRGNVVDMAVGVIMGTAFTAIINALVQSIIMPAIGVLIGGVNFSDLKIVLKPAAGEAAEVAIAYGAFIQQIFNFLIIAAVVFAMVKILNKLKKKEEAPAAPPAPPADIVLLTEIRDVLKEKKQ